MTSIYALQILWRRSSCPARPVPFDLLSEPRWLLVVPPVRFSGMAPPATDGMLAREHAWE
jgi:hypothetical protein